MLNRTGETQAWGRLSPLREFAPVPSHGSIIVYMISPQNIILARVTPAWVHLACDHALSLAYLFCNLFSGVGHDTFLLQITCKKSESELFSDWIGNNTDDLRCSDWPKCRHPLVVVGFSLHFCWHINEQWIRTQVRYEISAGSAFLKIWRMSK